MNFRKAALSFIAAIALMAFTVPMAQASPLWYTEPGEILLGGKEEKEEFTSEGELWDTFFFLFGTEVIAGPLEGVAHGYLWNEGEEGRGVIDEFRVEGPAPTGLPGCTLDAFTSTLENKEGGIEWSLPGGSTHLTVIKHYNAGCEKYGVPLTFALTGWISLSYDSETDCFDVSSDTAVEGTTGTVKADLSGEVCLHGSEGTFALR